MPLAAQLIIALLLGTLITLSLAPFDYWPLAIIALGSLHFLLQTATARQALLLAGAFGLGLFYSGAYWVFVSMHEHGNAAPILAGLMTFGFCSFIGLLLAPFGYLYARFLRDLTPGNTLGFAAIWLLSEWLKTWLLTGFPWLFAGYSQLDAPLMSWAPVIGTLGIGFILAYTAAVLSNSFQQRRPSWHLAALAVLWLTPLPLSTVQWTERLSDNPLQAALIQANVPQEIKWHPDYKQSILDHYRQQTEKLQDSDIIIWPETAIPEYLHRADNYLQAIHLQAELNDQAVILGIPSLEWHGNQARIYNSINGIGHASGLYHKQKLVPFGEYVPLESILRGLIDFFDLPMSSFSPGPAGQEPISAHGLKIMPYICYEVVYPDFVSRTAATADILLTISNDTWFGESIGPIQHMQMARMRALETGRYMLRGTNNGITGIIDNRGQLTAVLPQFSQAVLKGEVYAYKGLTPVMQYGTLPAVIFSFLIIAGLLLRRLTTTP